MSPAFRDINWTRFWVPREANLHLDLNGYLVDPDGEYGKALNPTAETLEAIAPRPCLGLLGEPGIGKTTAVRKYVEAFQKQLGPDDDLVYWNLAFGGSLDDLSNEPALLRWLATGATPPTLHLFLDSLDEYTDGGAERVAQWVLHQLRRGPLDRLRLRLACRTAAWPRMLDEHLPAFWKEDAKDKGTKIGVYELAPLRRRDVEQAASPDVTGFLHEVEKRQAVALAIKPITLNFLLSAYARDGRLPPRRWNLYERGCRMLCDEQSSTRSIQQAKLDVDQRFAIAARIAAVTMLGGRSMICRGPDSGDMPPEAVRDRELYGGTEKTGDSTVGVGADEVNEVFDVSGLFTARGKRALGWMHQTYAEFMAAWFLHNRGLSPEEMLREVTHDAVPGKVIPVLREVAAWLAGGDQSFFRLLVQRDPEVLLHSDFAKVEDADREMLVRTLLERIAAKNMLDDQLWGSVAVREFKHPGLAAQLRPYIINKDVYFMARRAAIDIAKHCQLDELTDAFLTVMLDAGDHPHIRTYAARMVVAMGDLAAKQQLRPFVFSQPRSETEDDLKGFAMQALWPDDLTARDLFDNLTAPHSQGYMGAYHAFVGHDLAHHLRANDLPEALKWVTTLPASHQDNSIFSFQDLKGAIMDLAWDHLDDPSTLQAFALAARSRLACHDGIFAGPLSRNDPDAEKLKDEWRRLRLLQALVEQAPPLKHEAAALVLHEGLVSPMDAPWMIKNMQVSRSVETQARWAQVLLQLLWRYWTVDILDPIIAAWEQGGALRTAAQSYWFDGAIEIDSPMAGTLREEEQKRVEQYAEMERLAASRHKSDDLPPADERIAECVQRFEAADVNAGWELQHWMQIDTEEKRHAHEYETDLSMSVVAKMEGMPSTKIEGRAAS